MERKIGEIFEYNGEWYQCIKDTERTSCVNCCFYNGGHKLCNYEFIGACVSECRSDVESICFKKLEKVGEPYCFQKRTFQTYKLHTIPFLSEDVELVAIPSKDNNTIEIEIKQNEYMEEKKLNLKPFDLEAAKAGKPVCTRDGRKARIICHDRQSDHGFPVVALVENPGAERDEDVHFYRTDGTAASASRDQDLVMQPEKKEGWVNLYKSDNSNFAAILGSAYAYNTKEEAINNADPDTTIATVKIQWEE